MMTFLYHLSDHPFLLVGLGLFGFIGMFITGRSLRVHNFADYVVKKGQYEPLPHSLLEQAVEQAKSQRNDKAFLAYITEIRRVHGRDAVKIGHLYWIWEQLEKGHRIDDIPRSDIPNFIKEAS